MVSVFVDSKMRTYEKRFGYIPQRDIGTDHGSRPLEGLQSLHMGRTTICHQRHESDPRSNSCLYTNRV